MESQTRVKLGLLLCVPLIAAGFLGAYSALDWLLVERTGWIALDREVVDLWVPLALAMLLAIAVVSPRVSILDLNEKRSIPLLYAVVAFATFAAPTIIAQYYIHAASGALVHQADASAVTHEALARYFRFDRLCLDRENPAIDTQVEASGQNDENLDIALYVAVPLCGGGDVRIGLKYTQTIDNHLTDSEKDALYRAFLKRSQQRFDAENPAGYTYLERIGASADLRGFDKALAKMKVGGSPIVLVPHTDPFAQRTGGELSWSAGTLAAGSLLWLVMVLAAPVNPGKLAPPSEPAEDPAAMRRLFVPTRAQWGLAVLIDTNILVYVAMVLSGIGVMAFQTDDLVAWGGNYGPALHGLGWLRLVSSQFVHGGLMHVANNMYGLLFAGVFLMPVAMNARLVALYLLCGTGGSVASAWMHPDTVSVGASGSIFGLFGVLLALVALGDTRLKEIRQMIFLNGAIFVGVNLAIGAATPGIDNAAHIGGLTTGLVLGAAVFLLDRAKTEEA